VLFLTSVILATQEAEIRRIRVQRQPGQIVHKTLILKKNPSQKKGLAEWLRWRPWVHILVPQKINYDKNQIYMEYLCLRSNYVFNSHKSKSYKHCYSHFVNEESKVTYLIIGRVWLKSNKKFHVLIPKPMFLTVLPLVIWMYACILVGQAASLRGGRCGY
jgi:hypothetical protein